MSVSSMELTSCHISGAWLLGFGKFMDPCLIFSISCTIAPLHVCTVLSQDHYIRGSDYLNVLQVGYVLRVVSIGFCSLYLMNNFNFQEFVELHVDIIQFLLCTSQYHFQAVSGSCKSWTGIRMCVFMVVHILATPLLNFCIIGPFFF